MGRWCIGEMVDVVVSVTCVCQIDVCCLDVLGTPKMKRYVGEEMYVCMWHIDGKWHAWIHTHTCTYIGHKVIQHRQTLTNKNKTQTVYLPLSPFFRRWKKKKKKRQTDRQTGYPQVKSSSGVILFVAWMLLKYSSHLAVEISCVTREMDGTSKHFLPTDSPLSSRPSYTYIHTYIPLVRSHNIISILYSLWGIFHIQ